MSLGRGALYTIFDEQSLSRKTSNSFMILFNSQRLVVLLISFMRFQWCLWRRRRNPSYLILPPRALNFSIRLWQPLLVISGKALCKLFFNKHFRLLGLFRLFGESIFRHAGFGLCRMVAGRLCISVTGLQSFLLLRLKFLYKRWYLEHLFYPFIKEC